jgi:SAM-dependent methyltransferase
MNLSTFRLRYFVRRIYDSYFQRKHPDCPWISPAAILLLDNWLKKTDRGFEWGSGRSTLWLARRVSHLVSIEDNPEWYGKVRERLSNEDLLKSVDYRLIGCGDCNDQSEPEPHPYGDVIGAFPDRHFDFIIVDGNIRLPCMRRALAKLKPGGLLALDNANRYFPNHFLGGFSTIHEPCAEPPSPGWAELSEKVNSWRWINTTNGIWDTRFWVKPIDG